MNPSSLADIKYELKAISENLSCFSSNKVKSQSESLVQNEVILRHIGDRYGEKTTRYKLSELFLSCWRQSGLYNFI